MATQSRIGTTATTVTRDEDGVLLKSVLPTRIGELEKMKGGVLKLKLKLPDEDIFKNTKKAIAGKP